MAMRLPDPSSRGRQAEYPRDGATASWHVDAWAIEDGRAFASYREPDATEAERTVFLEAPFFRADSVAHPAIARRAARSGFQDRLLDDDGREIGFETIEQIQDLVRRGYLAGGLGPQGGPIGDGPDAPDVDRGSPYLEPSDDEAVVAVEGPFALPEAIPDGLTERTQELARAYLRFVDQEFGDGGAAAQWLAAIEGTGLLGAELTRDVRWYLGPYWSRLPPWRIGIPNASMRADLRELPALPGLSGWPTVIRFSDYRTLAVVDRRFWHRPVPLRQLAAVLLASAVLRSPQQAGLDVVAREYQALRRRGPMYDLGEAAEQALTAYVDLRLGRRGRRQPPPTGVFI